MVTAYLLLGSNLGNRAGNLAFARQEISRLCGEIVTASSIYESEPWGVADQPWFYNQALEIKTPHQPITLLRLCEIIENSLGRTRLVRWGPRTLDIDILYYGGMYIHTEHLTIPPILLPARKFGLIPLTEIAPDLVHPFFQRTSRQMLNQCTDPLAVRKVL